MKDGHSCPREVGESGGVSPRTLPRKLQVRGLRIGAAITVVADAASVGWDAGSIRHEGTVIAAPVQTLFGSPEFDV